MLMKGTNRALLEYDVQEPVFEIVTASKPTNRNGNDMPSLRRDSACSYCMIRLGTCLTAKTTAVGVKHAPVIKAVMKLVCRKYLIRAETIYSITMTGPSSIAILEID